MIVSDDDYYLLNSNLTYSEFIVLVISLYFNWYSNT